MRLKVMCLLIWAFLLAQVASRPQQTGPETLTTEVTKELDEDARSRVESTSKRLKDYPSMDQALRTVTTQLLNVSEPDAAGAKDEKIQPKLGLLIRKPDRVIPPSRDAVNDNQKEMTVLKEISTDVNPVIVGRPVNSKYSFFESSHPGQAMAMTEEELEKEMASTRFPTSQRPAATTNGGLSTWILLNPPTTTEDKKLEETATTKSPTASTAAVKIETTLKADVKTTGSLQKTSTSSVPLIKGSSTKKPFATTTVEKTTAFMETVTTPRSDGRSTSLGPLSTAKTTKTTKTQEEEATTVKTTRKIVTTSRSTFKPKSTTPRSSTIVSKATTMKIIRPSQSRPSKPLVRKPTTTVRPEEKLQNSTSKIEKVTFKPVQMITTPKSTVESVAKPIFMTKIQAAIQTDNKSASLVPSSTETVLKNERGNGSSHGADQVTGKNKASKPNNILKVSLKKPADSPTTIEIEPIKVNAPVLTIERLPDKTIKEKQKDANNNLEPLDLENSKVDVKFDFSPELTKIETVSPSTTTTKRPKTSSKRKKIKIRRRKPSASASSASASTPAPIPSSTIPQEIPENATSAAESSLQESKVVPDSKITKTNKKKQVAKPIGTQIYNFLSREVMPSVGVMSLVGLGLGLASYFLYPFGGAIARRNYEVEPHYKYNPDEYGGNYGQNEEEVFSKVLQGMKTNDGKYGGIKDFEKNYYRYQVHDGGYTNLHTTRRTDPRYPSSSVPVYRPENTPPPFDPKSRSPEFKYPDLATTPNYYERQEGSDQFDQSNVDRQFVVGNVPKEYSSKEKKASTTTETVQTDFEKQIAQNLQFAQNPSNLVTSYGQPEAQPLKADHYDEIEITPTAVAVEHGPRSLKLEETPTAVIVEHGPRSLKLEEMDDDVAANEAHEVKKRMKRDSVIQMIPPRSETDREEEEEPLSNEILDIIDSALPEDMVRKDWKDGDAKKVHEEKRVDGEKKQEVTTGKAREELTTTVESFTTRAKETEVEESTRILTTTSATSSSTKSSSLDSTSPGIEPESETFPTNAPRPESSGFNVFDFVRRVAEVKFRLGLTILKHASESFARYLGHVQKRINGEE